MDEWEPTYRDLISAGGAPRIADLLMQAGWALPGRAEHDEPADYRTVMLDALADAVGGKHALEDPDDVPLPDEPFALAAVPDDIRRPVSDVLAWCDRCCDELLDVEYRTACRRLLAAWAADDPAVFRRSGRADTRGCGHLLGDRPRQRSVHPVRRGDAGEGPSRLVRHLQPRRVAAGRHARARSRLRWRPFRLSLRARSTAAGVISTSADHGAARPIRRPSRRGGVPYLALTPVGRAAGRDPRAWCPAPSSVCGRPGRPKPPSTGPRSGCSRAPGRCAGRTLCGSGRRGSPTM